MKWTWKSVVLAVLLTDFAAYTGWALYEMGPMEALAGAVANPAAVQVLIDLSIACGLFALWLWKDAPKQGMNRLAWMATLPFTGTLGALGYLLVRQLKRDGAAAADQGRRLQAA